MAVARHPRPGPRSLARPTFAAVLALLALAGCKRDLEVPATRSFTAAAARESLAPRETVSITVSGGQPPFSWAFADGGRLSGDDATVDPAGATVTYRSGSAGSAQDVLEVRDAAGATARVRITVTARLAVTPPSTIVAPGGIQALQGSGGRPPYTFTLTRPSSGADARVSPDVGTSSSYSAGSSGDVFDEVAVHDSVVPPTTVLVSIRVTSALQIFPRVIDAAPNEVVSFTAFGGQPPYTFHYESSMSGGQMLDGSAGLYQLGSWGPDVADAGALDVIQVVDANNRFARATVHVAPKLAAALASDDVRGGLAIPVLVSGGKPPYEFGFAPRGNRSHGSLDSFGGLYTPGPSPGARDVLAVTDAAGTSVTLTPPPVGPLRLTPGGGVSRCVTGDFDGNSVADVAFLHQRMKVTEITGIGSSAQLARTYFVGTDSTLPFAWAADQDRDGRTDLLFLGARRGTPADSDGFSTAFWGMVAGTDGVFDVVGPLSETPEHAQLGTHLPAPFATSNFLFASGCPGGLRSRTLDGLLPVWNRCIQVETPGELPQGPGSRLVALATPDLDGDPAGAADLAWLAAGSDSQDSPGPVHVRYGALTGVEAPPIAFVADPSGVTSVALPAGTYYQGQDDGEQRRLVTFPANFGGAPSGLLVRLADLVTGRGTLWVLAGKPATWTQLPDLLPTGGSGADGAALLPSPVPGIQNVVAWSQDGDVVTFQLLASLQLMQESRGYRGVVAPGTGQRYAGRLAQAGFPVTGACAADVTGDGAADLVLAGQSVTTADVLFGTDGLEFGTRPHFRGMSWPAALGDFDGDGLGDLVASEDGVGLSILHGTEDQLAWSERISSGPASLVAAGPYVAGGRGDSVIYRTTAGGFRLVRNGPASFEPAQVLTASKPDGTAVTATFAPLMSNAALGGPDQGPDLLTWESSHFGQAWAHVLWREGGRLVDLRSDAIGVAPAFDDLKVSDCWFLPVGAETGQATWGANEVHAGVAVAGVCNFQDPADPNRAARIVRWVGATIVGSGATLRLSSWTVSARLTGEAGADARVAPLGTVAGRALFAVWADTTANGVADGLAIVALGGPGAAANPATWGTTVPLTPVAFTFARRWAPFFGALGDLDGDGVSDAVLQTKEGRLLVIKNRGTDAAPDWGFQDNAVLWPDAVHGLGLGGGGLPLGVRPSRWLVPPAAGVPGILDKPSVITFVGDFDNLGVAPEIVPFVHRFHPDGSQGLE